LPRHCFFFSRQSKTTVTWEPVKLLRTVRRQYWYGIPAIYTNSNKRPAVRDILVSQMRILTKYANTINRRWCIHYRNGKASLGVPNFVMWKMVPALSFPTLPCCVPLLLIRCAVVRLFWNLGRGPANFG
jgi:hypothetical protein